MLTIITDASRLQGIRKDDGYFGQAGAAAASVHGRSILWRGPELELGYRSACTIPFVYTCNITGERTLLPQNINGPSFLSYFFYIPSIPFHGNRPLPDRPVSKLPEPSPKRRPCKEKRAISYPPSTQVSTISAKLYAFSSPFTLSLNHPITPSTASISSASTFSPFPCPSCPCFFSSPSATSSAG